MTKDNIKSLETRVPIAIIGMGCWLPGASDPKQLWENVLSNRKEFRRIPDVRTPLKDYYDQTGQNTDKFYQSKAAVIDGFEFDWVSYRIPESTYVRTDMCQWLALEIAHQAIKDAGFTRTSAPKDRTGVFIGNTCTGEGMRSNSMRLRWPVVQRAMLKAAELHGTSAADLSTFMETTEGCYKSIFPEISEDFLAGSISATIAGRICNYFDFHGGAFVIDAACASSLATVVTAANMLASEDLDLALAGGVDISLDPFELTGFSRNGALSKSEIRPYDKRGDGFIPGEGGGLVVLKRLADAERDGDSIYAVLRGWGLSSDGKAGIMQPVANQQAAAITRAITSADCKLEDIDFVEGHGTGTRAGDRTELEGLSLALAMDKSNTFEDDTNKAKERSCGIGSLKSLVGHTKAAAGVASLIKAVAAVNRRVIPPTASCEEHNDAFAEVGTSLFPIRHGEVRPSDTIMRAGVSAFGFGGINTHLTIESNGPPSPNLTTQSDEDALLVSYQESELFIFGGETKQDMLAHIETIAAEAPLLSQSDLIDLAVSLSQKLPSTINFRAAVIANSADDLETKLLNLITVLSDNKHTQNEGWLKPFNDIYIATGNNQGRIGFLFPGQGSQQLLMVRTLVERYDWAKKIAEQAEQAVKDGSLLETIFRPIDRASDQSEIDAWVEKLSATELAQPAICLASTLCARYLNTLGIHPTIVGGHSLGEITALHEAGAFDKQTLFSIASLRGHTMRAKSDKAGAMASLACSRTKAEEIVSQISDTLVIANINAPNQTVVSGEAVAINQVISLAKTHNISCRRLPVSNAFHSPLMTEGAKLFEAELELSSSLSSLSLPVISGVESVLIDENMNLRQHLSQQIISPVNFISLAKEMKKSCDVFIEVGPGRTLSGLCDTIFDESDICTPLAANALKWNPNPAVAIAFVNGIDINWQAFYENRLVRPYINPSKRIYLENPAERPIDLEQVSIPKNKTLALQNGQSLPGSYLQRRGKFIAEVARLDMASLSDNEGQPDLELPKLSPTSIETDVASLPKEQTALPTLETPENAGLGSFGDVSEMLTTLISERTGYPKNSITPDQRLLDDLNLDSIKAGELVAEGLRRIGAAGAIDATKFANSSLTDIATALHKTMPEMPTLKVPPLLETQTLEQTKSHLNGKVTAETQSTDNVIDLLIDLTSERTGYPKNSITPDQRLLDDLNLDSIKAGELVAEVLRRIGAAGAIDATKFANSSLTDIATALHETMPEMPTLKVPPLLETPTLEQTNSHLNGKVTAETQSTDSVIDLLIDLTSERTGYPKNSITPDQRLLDDLNLDSIKAGELVAEGLRRIGVEGTVDATKFANASLTDIATVFSENLPKTQAISTPVATPAKIVQASTQPLPASNDDLSFLSRYTTWTRNFVVQAVPVPSDNKETANGQGQAKDLSNGVFLIFYDPCDPEPAKKLYDDILARGGQAEQISFDSVKREKHQSDNRYTHQIAILPRVIEKTTPEQRVAEIALRLTSLANVPENNDPGKPARTVTYIQFGGGVFGSDDSNIEPELCNTLAFARTLHLEREDLRVRVLDFASSIETSTIAELTLDEITDNELFHAVGFDDKLTRRTPIATLSEPKTYKPRSIAWSEQDIILVTGGAKGIMAECALGLARETGATLVLIGRGKPSAINGGDPANEIDKALERFRSEGLRHFYFSCDITDYDALAEVLKKIEKKAGAITGVVHGASVLRPCRIDNLTVDGLIQEVSPKVLGAWNLCRLLNRKHLKLFVSFSSLVVDHGMPWSAGYAFANELMERVVQNAAVGEQPIPLQIISYGLWGEVGRPAALNTNDHLLSVGLHDGEIPPEEGVRRLVEVFTHDPETQRLCVYGRSVGYAPWDQLRPEATLPNNLRFIEQVLHMEPEVELIARCRLTLERDQYLHDHVYNGMYIVPTVLALEILAQAAYALVGDELPLSRMDSILMPYPIVVDAKHGLEIELHAEVQETTATDKSRKINVSVSTEQTGYKTSALSGTVVFSKREEAKQAPITLQKPMDINPSADLYDRQFFVGPTYQRMREVYSVDPDQTICSGETRSEKSVALETFNPLSGSSKDESDDALVLGDPFFRDTLLHSSLLNHLKHISFTSRIDKIELFQGCEPQETQQRLCIASLKWSKDKDAEYELVSASPDGQIFERWTGYCSTALDQQSEWPKLQDLIELERSKKLDQKKLSEQIVNLAEQFNIIPPVITLDCINGFSEFSIGERHLYEHTLADQAVAALFPEIKKKVILSWLPNGRPQFEAEDDLDVSFSHEGWYCLCSVGSEKNQGCDLAAISPRSKQEWFSILGAARQPMLSNLSTKEPIDRAGTRIWAALEAARKALTTDDEELSIVEHTKEGVLFRAKTPNKEIFILTLSLRFLHGPQSIVAMTVSAPDYYEKEETDTAIFTPATHIIHDDDLGCDVLESKFNISWKECTSLGRKVTPACYVNWFHKTREAMLSPDDSRRWVSGVLDGTAGLVASSIRAHLHDEATAHDEMFARIWMTQLSDNKAVWRTNFYKKTPSGKREHIASVEAEGRIVKQGNNGTQVGTSNATHDYERYLQTRFIESKEQECIGFKKLQRGPLVFEAPSGPQSGPLLFAETMYPSLIDSDLVGNVSSIRFFEWLAHVRDLFLHSVVPNEMVRRIGKYVPDHSEALCIYEDMTYLREAFPFDDITVEMRLVSATKCSARICYQFIRMKPEGNEKLAVGYQEWLWMNRDDADKLHCEDFPRELGRLMKTQKNENHISKNMDVT